jgi:hypothetical protein
MGSMLKLAPMNHSTVRFLTFPLDPIMKQEASQSGVDVGPSVLIRGGLIKYNGLYSRQNLAFHYL